MGKVKYILLDCDNTLCLSERLAFEACTDLTNELLEKYIDHPERDQIIAREMGWHHLLGEVGLLREERRESVSKQRHLHQCGEERGKLHLQVSTRLRGSQLREDRRLTRTHVPSQRGVYPLTQRY